MDSWDPTEKQAEFLAADEDEVLYGGAAGGGKSDAMLVDALGLQQGAVSNLNYRALLLRKTFPQLRKLLDRAQQLYPRVAPGAIFYDRPWTEWRFPVGAKIIFGACDRDVDVHDYQGHEFQYIGVDELGHYGTPYVWDYLSSRLRTADPALACYMRASCNPGPKWIQERFGIADAGTSCSTQITVQLEDGRTVTKRLRYIQSLLRDNPYLARDGQYEANLARLPNAEREALLHGRWGVIEVPGAIYRDELTQAREGKRITGVPYDKAALVNTYWDIGVGSAMQVLCAQRVGREWHWINHYVGTAGNAPEAAAWLKATGYAFGEHYLPHDARARESGSGSTFQEVLLQLGLRSRVLPMLGVEEGITALKLVFPQVWVDAGNCAELLRSLMHYRRDWKDKQGQFAQPVHDWACLKGDTKLLTRHGMCQIMDLPEKGEVMTQCGWKQYTNPHVTRRAAPLVEVRFSDGYTVRCTPEHRFLTASGWKFAAWLRKSTPIQSYWTRSLSTSMADSIGYGQASITTRAAARASTALYGLKLSALFLQAVISITEMATREITPSPILNACRAASIYPERGTRPKILARIASRMRRAPPLPLGTAQKLVGSGIVATHDGRRTGPNGSASRAHASAAARRLIVWCVRKLGRRNTVAPIARPLHIVGVVVLNETADVWCLTVPDAGHFALANGAIVHNSHGADTARYFAVASRQTGEEYSSLNLPTMKFPKGL